MKKLLRSILWCLLALTVAAAGCLWWLWRDSSLNYQNHAVENGVTCWYNSVSRRAFAGYFTWDGVSADRTVAVPDEAAGYPVVALGGYFGRGVPCCFDAALPESAGTRCGFSRSLLETIQSEHPDAPLVETPLSRKAGKKPAGNSRSSAGSLLSAGERRRQHHNLSPVLCICLRCGKQDLLQPGRPALYPEGRPAGILGGMRQF